MKRVISAVAVVLSAVAVGTSGAGTSTIAVGAAARNYAPGSLVKIAIANSGSTRILVPAGGTWCSLFTIQRFSQHAWHAAARCSSKPTMLLSIPSGRTLSGSLANAVGQPVVGTVSPGRLDVDLRTLPVQVLPAGPPPKANEVPLGILDPRSAAPNVKLGPGEYRVVISYFVGSAAGAQLKAHSGAFTVQPS